MDLQFGMRSRHCQQYCLFSLLLVVGMLCVGAAPSRDNTGAQDHDASSSREAFIWPRVLQRFKRTHSLPTGVNDMLTSETLHPESMQRMRAFFLSFNASLACVYCDESWPPTARHCVLLSFKRDDVLSPIPVGDVECEDRLKRAVTGDVPNVLIGDGTFPWLGMPGHDIKWFFQDLVAFMKIYRLRNWNGVETLVHPCGIYPHPTGSVGTLEHNYGTFYAAFGFRHVNAFHEAVSPAAPVNVLLMPHIFRLSARTPHNHAGPYFFHNPVMSEPWSRIPTGFSSLGWFAGYQPGMKVTPTWPDPNQGESYYEWLTPEDDFPLYPDDITRVTDLMAWNLGVEHISPSHTELTATFVNRHGTRRITNQDAMLQVLKDIGFYVYILDFTPTTNFTDVVAQLRRTHVLVGAHGSGISEAIIHMLHKTVFIEIMPYGWTSYVFAQFAMVKRVHHLILQVHDPENVCVCKLHGVGDDIKRNYPIKVDVDEFNSTVSTAIALLETWWLFRTPCHVIPDFPLQPIEVGCPLDKVPVFDDNSPECRDCQLA